MIPDAPDAPDKRRGQLCALLEALEVTGWAPGDKPSPLAACVQAEPAAGAPGADRTWRPGLFAVAVLAADAVRQELGDESWARVAALAAEWDLADGALYAAKAYGVIWNRLSDRAALDQAVNWAGFAARLASQAGWKAAACAYQHALLLSQRAAAGDGPEGDLDLAIDILRAVTGQAPGDHQYQYRLASTLLTRYRTPRRAGGDLDEAVNAAQRAVEARPADDGWRTACVHVLAAARMARWKSAARHGDDLALALEAIESELESQPGDSNLLAAAIGVLRQRSKPGDLEKAANLGERLTAGLNAGDPDASDQFRTLARLEADLFDQSGDPGHLDKGISFAERASSPHDDPSRVQQRENVLAWLHAARAGTAGRRPGDSARAAALAQRAEASPIPEVALSSIRAGSLACLAEGDWAGAARSARRALELLSELTDQTGPDVIEDWLSLTQGLAAMGAYGLARQGDAPGAALFCERGAAIIAARTGVGDPSDSRDQFSPRQLAVPSGSVIVQLAVTPVGAVALVTGPGVATFSVDLPALTEDKVTKWSAIFLRVSDVVTGPADAQVALDEMASALAPLYHRLDAGHVRLVPVGRIAGLPVSAVIERATGSPVSVAGSAALHARAALANRVPTPPIRTLAVTSPQPCSAGPVLPGASREGKWLAACEACAVTHLDGTQATRASVLAALSAGADLVHFGTHGRFDAEHPLHGALYLADGPGGTAETLSPAELTGPAAVVLACCTLADVGRRLPNEHQGFNSAMLAAGTWFVLSPLWPVGDTVTTKLVTAFYQHLFGGGDPAAALLAARARTRERYGTQSPGWASWVLAGG